MLGLLSCGSAWKVLSGRCGRHILRTGMLALGIFCSPCHVESITHFSGCLSVAGSFTINSDAIDVLMLGLVWWLRYSKAVCKLVDQLVSSLIISMYNVHCCMLVPFCELPKLANNMFGHLRRRVCRHSTPLHKSPSVSARANGCPAHCIYPSDVC